MLTRWLYPEKWFALKVREGYLHVMVTTRRVYPREIPGDHVSIVSGPNRVWGFKYQAECVMAHRIAGGEVR